MRQVSSSRRTLERRFRTILERGIGEEIRRVRIERAGELLAATALSVAEVAEQSGFASVHYLSRVSERNGPHPERVLARRQSRNPTGVVRSHT